MKLEFAVYAMVEMFTKTARGLVCLPYTMESKNLRRRRGGGMSQLSILMSVHSKTMS